MFLGALGTEAWAVLKLRFGIFPHPRLGRVSVRTPEEGFGLSSHHHPVAGAGLVDQLQARVSLVVPGRAENTQETAKEGFCRVQ